MVYPIRTSMPASTHKHKTATMAVLPKLRFALFCGVWRLPQTSFCLFTPPALPFVFGLCAVVNALRRTFHEIRIEVCRIVEQRLHTHIICNARTAGLRGNYTHTHPINLMCNQSPISNSKMPFLYS